MYLYHMNSQSSIFSFNLSKKYLIWHMYQIQQLEEKICCVGKKPFYARYFSKTGLLWNCTMVIGQIST